MSQDQEQELPYLGGKKETYAPFLIHEKALQFIEKNKTNPFFMFYPSLIPHAELVVPDKYLEKYRNDFLPEKNISKKIVQINIL